MSSSDAPENTPPPEPEAPFGYKGTGEPRKSRNGRPSLLSDEKVKSLIGALSLFAPVETACGFAGIDKATFYRWLKRGALDTAAKKNTKYKRFRDAVKKAIAAAELGCVGVIVEAAKGTPAKTVKDARGKIVVVEAARPPAWQAAAWMAERRNPRTYARRTYRIEDSSPANQGSVGVVEQYRVSLPEVDPDPSTSGRPEAAREEQGVGEAVKRKEHDSDAEDEEL